MTIKITVPVLPESVADALVSVWHKKPGDAVMRDETIVDLETDKVVLEVPAPEDGVLKSILKPEGETVVTDEILAEIEPGAVAKDIPESTSDDKSETQTAKATVPSPSNDKAALSPAVRRMVSEHAVAVDTLQGTGKGGRITPTDVTRTVQSMDASLVNERSEKRVPMSRLRARVAERLLAAQHEAAILTTFNEINLKAVMDIRAKYKEHFVNKHGVRLGLMSFFTKAVVQALKRFPVVNASIDGADVVYHNYYDIGVAVSTERGLVVPVLRNVDSMSMAEIESAIGSFAEKARNNQITMDDMTGGTFTITNGGRFGSLLSTPIINPPQTGILGMHTISERAMVEHGEVVVRPMMYIALSYDHRLIDGKDSVQFVVTIKELLEDPAKLLLDI